MFREVDAEVISHVEWRWCMGVLAEEYQVYLRARAAFEVEVPYHFMAVEADYSMPANYCVRRRTDSQCSTCKVEQCAAEGDFLNCRCQADASALCRGLVSDLEGCSCPANRQDHTLRER